MLSSYGVTLIPKETYLDDSVSFDTIQYLQQWSYTPNRHILLVSGLTIIKHVIHAHLITMVIQVCIKQILFKYL